MSQETITKDWAVTPTLQNLEIPMICVLNVLDGPASGKRICILENQCFEIGRQSLSDFPITADGHLSRRHLLIDSTKQCFRVRDLGSSNGTFVNDNRIEVETLREGDLIRAGSSVFEVRFVKSGENPHESDGTVFGKTISAGQLEPGEPQRTINFEASSDSRNNELKAIGAPKVADFEATVLSNVAHDSIQSGSSDLVRPAFLADFEPDHTLGVYRLLTNYSSPLGRFSGILAVLSAGRKVSLIVNQSQIAPDLSAIKPLQMAGHLIEPIANSLRLIHGESAMDFEEFIMAQAGKDAFIGLIHDSVLVASDLKELANSFSFPSLFSRHISQLSSPCRVYFESKNIDALYESDKRGQIIYYSPKALQT